jgi:hypothetical protein
MALKVPKPVGSATFFTSFPLSLLITTRTRNRLSPDINNTATQLMREELNAIVGQPQGQVSELNAPLSAPALTPTSSVTPVCLAT